MGTVDFDGSALEVCLAYVPEAEPGDFVLVHAGFALTLLDEGQAARTIETLRELGNAPMPEPPSRD
ncbi:MAG: HypC/HybG/HupF family hydrogenase formation chaperone [Candidatus Krumholzibacteriota bacterium]